jgi:release factor glutamine methyltransferase
VHTDPGRARSKFEPFDLLTCNPPYLPFDEDANDEPIPAAAGPETAWNAGRDGRQVLDSLCEHAPQLLADTGTILLVQSEFATIGRTVNGLRTSGLHVAVVVSSGFPSVPY